MILNTRSVFFKLVMGFGMTAGAFVAGGWLSAQAPMAPAPFKAEDPAYRNLDASLYMQTSAEYRACCYQAYNLATLRLREAVAENKGGAKLAVVMDLDETVLDNGGFQAMQIRSNLTYDQRIWDIWEKDGSDMVGLIPGAKDFILEAKKIGVTVIYITNRNEKFRESARKALKRLEIDVQDDSQLLLCSDNTDKTSRRQKVEKDYTVALFVGDNLRDFDDVFRSKKMEKKTPEELEAAIKERKETVDKHRDLLGKKWIIIPNPAYGEWMKPLGLGKTDLDRLYPTKPAK